MTWTINRQAASSSLLSHRGALVAVFVGRFPGALGIVTS
jgi:hypothetical protein